MLAAAQMFHAQQNLARTQQAIVQAFLDLFSLRMAFLCAWQDGPQRFELLAHAPVGARDGAYDYLERYTDELRPLWHDHCDDIPEVRVLDAGAQLVTLPLARQGHVIGLLVLAVAQDSELSRREQRLMEMVAFQAGLALAGKQLCRDIRRERDQLQVMFDSVDAAMILLDASGRLLRFNPAAEALLDRDLSSYLGRSVFSWLRDVGGERFEQYTGLSTASLREYIWGIAAQPLEPHRRQFTQHSGDTVRFIDETGMPVLDRNGQVIGWLIVWRDNTAMRELERMRQELSSMIVHDLRNPITSITSSLMMLHDLIAGGDLDTGVLLDVVNIARSSANYMVNLVQSILDVARLEENNLVLDRESFSLDDCVDYAVTSVTSQARAAGIALAIDVPGDLPAVWVDAEKIRRVIVNLLDNAVRHTPQGGRVRLAAWHDTRADAVITCVEDTGPGVPPEARNRIFDKFMQLGKRAPRGYSGTGLGLAFCKMVVEAHDGMIWVEDASLGGAAFCFSLPTTPPETALGDVTPSQLA